MGALLQLGAVALAAAQDGSAKVNADPAQFEVTVTGTAAKRGAATSNAIVLIPGLASPGAVWDSTVEHLCRRGPHQCHVLSLAGYAGKPAVAKPSLDTVRRQLAAYIRTKGLAQPTVIGHSLGGFLALQLASTEPALVGRVVAVDSLPAMGAAQYAALTSTQLRDMAQQRRTAMLAQPPGAFDATTAAMVPTMVNSPGDAQKILAWTKESDRTTVVETMTDLMGTDLREDVARITAPVLVLGTWIAYKAYVPRETVEATFRDQYRKTPKVTIDMADNARHFVMYDDPAWMLARIDRFLAQPLAQPLAHAPAP